MMKFVCDRVVKIVGIEILATSTFLFSHNVFKISVPHIY